MKKIFFIFSFIVTFIAQSDAKLQKITDQNAIPRPQQQKNEKIKINSMSRKELEDFLAKRIKNTIIEDIDKVSTSNVNAIRSPEAQEAIKQKNKSEFQKIYENALNKVIDNKKTSDAYIPQTTPEITQQQKLWKRPNFPVIEAILPDSPNKVLIPAQEHIPYFLSKIDILPDGTVKIEETITVVANGKKLKYGLHKRLPERIILRDNSKQALRYTFVSAEINGMPIEYDIIHKSSGFFIYPANEKELAPGVYTYHFVYLVHNLMGIYDDFDEFYWDITGSSWNLVIDKIGAIISYPTAGEPLGQIVLIGAKNNLRSDFAEIVKLNPISFGYRGKRPLFIGEGFHIISSLPHGNVAKQSIGDQIYNIIEMYSDFVFSFMGFVMIICGFLVSQKYVRLNIGQLKIALKKSAAAIRFLKINRYDIKSFAAFLLELYKKNIIDIQQNDETILLVKRTDNLKNLSKYERKSVQAIFGDSDAVFNFNKNNLIKIKRASAYIEKELKLVLNIFRLKLNSGYIIFSLAMLFISELFMALFVDNLPILRTLIPATMALMIGCLLFYLQPLNNIYNVMLKSLGTAVVILAAFVLSSVVSVPTIIMIFAAIIAIFYFTSNFTKRNTLLKPYIEEIATIKEYIQQHHDDILLGREIINQQANILALDLEDEFLPSNPKEYNKLGIITELIKRFG